MLESLERKQYGRIRAAAVVFAVLVAGLLLVDYLLFAVKENPVKASIRTDAATVTSFTDSLLEVKIPLIITNDLSMDVTSGDLVVTVNGKEVKLNSPEFTSAAGSRDTVLIPLSFSSVTDSSVGTPLDLKISFSAASLYRKWSGKYSGSFSPASILQNIMNETAESFADSEKTIRGEYTLQGTALKAKLTVENPFSYPVTLEFESKPIINTGDGKSVSALSIPEPLSLSPKAKGEITASFNLKQPANPKDKTPQKTYALSGSLTIRVMNMEEKRSKTVILK